VVGADGTLGTGGDAGERGGGGGGGLYGGGGAGYGGGGGGGSSLVPAGGTATVDATGTPQVRITYPDTSAPTTEISLNPSSPNGQNGWYTSAVTLNVSATDFDGPSGLQTRCVLDPSSPPASFGTLPSTPCAYLSPGASVSSDGTHTLYAASVDPAGNTEAQVQSATFKIDATPPTISAAAATQPNANGWYTANVTVHFTCNDVLSGVASCPPDQVLSGEGSAVPSTPQTAIDMAGNTSAPSDVVTVKIDKTAPTISAAATTQPNANGWYNANVTVHFTCNDASSGVASCPPDQVLSGEGSAVSSTPQTVTDMVGNTSTPSNVVTVKIDKTAPTVTYSGNAGSYTVDQTVQITCTSNDALSGVATSTCQNISGPAYSFGMGAHTYSATATDKAGNTSSPVSTSFTVSVTPNSLQSVINRFCTDPGVAASLDQDVANIAQAPNANAKMGILQGFTQLVQAQTGKSLTSAQAKVLITLASAL
jgi:hypothetical protein